jgi:hypothetical protein
MSSELQLVAVCLDSNGMSGDLERGASDEARRDARDRATRCLLACSALGLVAIYQYINNLEPNQTLVQRLAGMPDMPDYERKTLVRLLGEAAEATLTDPEVFRDLALPLLLKKAKKTRPNQNQVERFRMELVVFHYTHLRMASTEVPHDVLTHASTHAHTHARTHTRTHARMNRPKSFPRKKLSDTR